MYFLYLEKVETFLKEEMPEQLQVKKYHVCVITDVDFIVLFKLNMSCAFVSDCEMCVYVNTVIEDKT